MARIEWVKQRLEAWARWSTAPDSGGLGYPSAAAFTRVTPRSTAAGFLPVSDADAMETERAVQSMLPHHIDLWHTLQAYYIKGYDIARCARVLTLAESSVKARLGRADAVLADWFAAKAQIAEQARRNKTP